MKEWVKAHPDNLRELAGFIVENISYVDQSEFEDALQDSLEAFKRNLMGNSYILVNPETEYRGGEKSNEWVYKLALEKGMSRASLIVSEKDMDVKDYMRQMDINDMFEMLMQSNANLID